MATKDAYRHRGLQYEDAPLELDSDPDFNPGAYVPESPKKAKTKKRVSRKSKQKNSMEEDSEEDPGPKRKRRKLDNGVGKRGRSTKVSGKRVKAPGPYEPNPLAKYFGEDLDLHSTSEDDGGDEEEEEEEENSGDEKDRDPSPIRPSLSAFKPKASNPPTAPKATSSSARSTPALSQAKSSQDGKKDDAEDSETEEDEGPIIALPRIVRPTSQSDSETEVSDGPIRILPPVQKRLALQKPKPSEELSTTESESEPEIDLRNKELHARPGFPLKPGQQYEKPLVLDDEDDIKVPPAINTYLRNYQQEGVKFLWRQYKDGRGGLLGDDMGLGKTIQVISFLSAIMKKTGCIGDKGRRRKHVSILQDGESWKKRRQLPPANHKWPTCLIIAPSTVVHNWEREFQTWGYFEVGLYNGTPKERAEVLHDFKLGRLDVVVTSFDVARRDINLLDDMAWSCVFVDEVHRVKNESAKITMAYHQFATLRRFGLTGTTIQNSYKEMWTILDWTNPDRLGTKRQWHGYVVKPLTAGQSAGASEDERAKAFSVALVLRDKLLPEFFLRRTKDIIKDQLPQKTDQVVFCPLTERQIAVYKNLLGMDAMQNLVKRDKACPCGSRKARKACCHPFVAGDVFRFMSILIKLSNHLALILPGPNDTPEQTARNRQLAEFAFPDGNIPKYGPAMLRPEYCGKWAALEVLLKEWRKDKTNKVLIFTKSVKLLEMLEYHVDSRGYGFLKLDGSTKQSERMPIIDKFNHDRDVFLFLISTLAGGTGLNLTGANKVVIFDPNWNPAHDLQAMDRAFRFGQTRDVAVYRLLGAGSVEELIYARQIYKQQQMAIGYEASVQTRYFEGIQGDNAKKGELFGIENIFKLHEDKLATKMAIEKASMAELDWALANMDGSSSSRKRGAPKNEIAEAEAKVGKEDSGLKGLGALLFDEAPPTVDTEKDAIQRTLNAIGVKYSHNNDEILVPSKIEAERTKQTILKARRRKSQAGAASAKETGKGRKGKKKADEAGGGAVWPPLRKHHASASAPAPAKAGPSGIGFGGASVSAAAQRSLPNSTLKAKSKSASKPRASAAASSQKDQRLEPRYRALIRLGMIEGPDELPEFAREFARQSEDERRKIIDLLDKWLEGHPEVESESSDDED